ncbi:kynurenine formamidase-like [Centruroides vittatus]|uniref:kynurenine formamidase-like n=1 Tax=Centruroides vittatus TaxID=120091 RepID=UPI0035109D42
MKEFIRFALLFSSCLVYFPSYTLAEKTASDKYYLDLTHLLSNSSTSYSPDVQPFRVTISKKEVKDSSGSFWYQTENYATSTLVGTHLEAPCSFYKESWCVNDIPMDHLIAPATFMNISEEVKTNASYKITSEDFICFEQKNGKIKNGSILLIYTGWSRYWNEPDKYFGKSNLGFPSLSEEAARWLVANRSIVGIGIDTASVDPGTSTNFRAHRIFAEKNMFILANVANMDQFNYTCNRINLYVSPLKITGASNAQCSIVAQVENSAPLASSVWMLTILLCLFCKLF